ncbi:universal stress protein [Nocardioides sp. GXQ0305]|uniref:universal stress protein n=1 Tax=Nocardioides sp. GXQ0305 TaxID=3423912 RepID=UPI003D7F005B
MAEVVKAVDLDGGVLVGYDGSPASEAALRWASGIARRLDEPLHVLRAWGMMNAPVPATKQGGYIPPLVDWEGAVRDELEAKIGRMELDCDLRLHVVHDQASAALLHAAKGAHLLVVARRGAGGFRGLGFGSTADQVARHSPCPVVVVPVDGHA